MRKRIYLITVFMAAMLSANAQKARVAIVDQKVKGEYFDVEPGAYPINQSKGKFYIIGVGQDEDKILKSRCRVETWTAEDGHGFLCVADGVKDDVCVRQSATVAAAVIDRLPATEEGDIPESYECMGKTGGWYKISVGEKTGYVKADDVIWLLNYPDCGGCIR